MADYATGLLEVGRYFVGKGSIWRLLIARADLLALRNSEADAKLSLVYLVDKYANGRNVLAKTWELCDTWSQAFVPWSDADAQAWSRLVSLLRSASTEQPDPVLRQLVYRAYVMGSVLAARAPNYHTGLASGPGVAGDMPALFPTLFCCALYAHVFHPDNERHTFETLMVALVGKRHGFCEVDAASVQLPGMEKVDKDRVQLFYYESFLNRERKADDWVSFLMNLSYTAKGGKVHPFAITNAIQLEMGLMHLPFALRVWQATPKDSQLLVGRYGEAEPYAGRVLYSQPGYLWVELFQRSTKTKAMAHFVLSYSTLTGSPTFVLREWTGTHFANTRGFNLHLEEGSSNYTALRKAYRSGRPAVLDVPPTTVIRGA